MAKGPGLSPQQANQMARMMIVNNAVKMTNQIFDETVTPSSQSVINIPPRNVGFLLGFWVEVIATITENNTGTPGLTPFGPANLVDSFVFNDLNNNQRINTTGWHMNLINSARASMPFLSAETLNSYPIDYGYNFTDIISAPATLTQNAANTVRMLYYVPLAYSEHDLRGGVYANVVNATMQLQINLNANPVIVAGANSVSAVYDDSSIDVTYDSCRVRVHQVYYDQLPKDDKGFDIFPRLDTATIYELKNTTVTGMSANSDFPISYSNFRDFLSTFFVYANGTELNDGSDITSFALQSANYTNIFKVPPKLVGAWGRQNIQGDFPSAAYYFPTRQKPISTVQYGNMELVLNASTVNSGARGLIGYESFALTNVISGAASLNAG